MGTTNKSEISYTNIGQVKMNKCLQYANFGFPFIRLGLTDAIGRKEYKISIMSLRKKSHKYVMLNLAQHFGEKCQLSRQGHKTRNNDYCLE